MPRLESLRGKGMITVLRKEIKESRYNAKSPLYNLPHFLPLLSNTSGYFFLGFFTGKRVTWDIVSSSFQFQTRGG